MRIATNHELVNICRASGYPVEYVRNFDGTVDHSTCVVSFPCKHPDGTVLARDLTAIDQLEFVRKLQREWSDNAVSCTVYYRSEELPLIREYLAKHYSDNFKSLSFLLHNDHGFEQAPLEEITQEQYEELKAKTRPITSANSVSQFELDECAKGSCPVR